MMDYFLLMIIKKILNCTATRRRILLGAFVGAILTCVVTVFPHLHAFVKFILFHGFVNIVMIKIGLKIRWDQTFVKAFLMLYMGGFLLGGVLGFFWQNLRVGSLFFVLAILSYHIAMGIWDILLYLAKQKEFHCEVVLCDGENKVRVNAIIDTGNTLKDSQTGKPVSIITTSTASQLFCLERQKEFRYISYCSIGKSDGVMPLWEASWMCICRKPEKMVEAPLLAVCDEEISAGEYQMILNPDV